jgi:hypothetical protein
MRYVHVAADHAREIPDVVLQAGLGEADPDRRIITMLGARVRVVSAASIVREESEAVTAS